MKTKRLIDADDLLIAFGNALNNATLKIGYGFMEWVVNEQPTIDPESLRPTAKWLVVRLMADGAEGKCGHGCRKDKGSHKAAQRLQYWMRQVSRKPDAKWYYLKLDISKFFYRVNHAMGFRHRGGRPDRSIP